MMKYFNIKAVFHQAEFFARNVFSALELYLSMRSIYLIFAIGAKRFRLKVEIGPTFSAFRRSAHQKNNMADNIMSEESRRRSTSSINSLKELLARSQQQELNVLEEGSVTDPFADIQLQQQMENTSQSIPNTGIEQG